jgi:hypothetical protein
MAVNDLSTPHVSTDVAQFGGRSKTGSAGAIDYNVPLPGGYPINRIVPLDIDAGWFTPESATLGNSLVDLGVVQQNGQGVLSSIDTEILGRLYRLALPADARPSMRAVAKVGGQALPLLADFERGQGGDGDNPPALMVGDGGPSVLDRRQVIAEPDDVDVERRRTASYIVRLTEEQVRNDPAIAGPVRSPVFPGQGTIRIPTPGLGSTVQEVSVNPVAPAVPRLALVETWELRSYLGDYGLGRTLATFSLLPGERTTITVETWRTDAATREDSTSILDSSDTAAQSRFASSLGVETGSAFQDQGGWALSVATRGSGSGNLFGIVEASASGEVAFAANHQEASQRWSNNISQTANEHANQVNNSRRQAVQSSSTSTTASGTATTTVREIANTNLRRVLNFVYRELNQTYNVYVVLRDIKIAFYNGRLGSAEIVPLSDLRRLIQSRVRPERQEEVARFVLGLCVERLDFNSDPVPVLQVGSRADGIHYAWSSAALANDGTLSFEGNPLATDVRWRFAPGPLTANEERQVNGLITSKSEAVLRTDSVVVEALLGQADALDPYASALQALDLKSREADIAGRRADTRRTTDALDLVQEAGSNSEQIAAWTQVFPQVPDIQVVPVAAVTNEDDA